MQRVIAVLAMSVLTLAACGSTVSGLPTANPGNTGSAGGGGGGGGVVFNEQLNLTGTIPVQGPLTDNSDAYGQSCSDYAAHGSTVLGGWFGPTTGTVAGHSVLWSLQIATAKYHGPGTYAAELFTVLSIDNNVYGGGTTSVTINADGSGSAQVTNDAGNPGQTESGTMTWTCTGS